MINYLIKKKNSLKIPLILSFFSILTLNTINPAVTYATSQFDDTITTVSEVYITCFNTSTHSFGEPINVTTSWNNLVRKSDTNYQYDTYTVNYENGINMLDARLSDGIGWSVSQMQSDTGVNYGVYVAVSGDATTPAVFDEENGIKRLRTNTSSATGFIVSCMDGRISIDGGSGAGVTAIIATSTYRDGEWRKPLFVNNLIEYPQEYEGTTPPADVFLNPTPLLRYEVDNKHIEIKNASPDTIPDTPLDSPDFACSAKIIEGFDDFRTVYESNTTYCSTIFKADVETYGKYNIALKYWKFTGSRSDGIDSSDYTFIGEASVNRNINGSKFSGGADSIGSTEICDATGRCRADDGTYSPCIAWGEPLVTTNFSEPTFLNPQQCFNDFGVFFSTLSFGVVNIGTIQENPNQCRQLVVIDDWLDKQNMTACAQMPSAIRDVITPIVTMIISILVLTWLVNRGDKYGV